HQQTRRHFFEKCGVGLGSIALGDLLANERSDNPMALRRGHHPPKAKNVIFLFMAGGPSHLELFESKPKLNEYHGKLPPDSLVEGKRFAFLGEGAKLLGSERKFAQYGESRMELSELLPH